MINLKDYPEFSIQLSRDYSIDELKKQLKKLEKEKVRLLESHSRSIDKTTSMTSNSQRRAQSRNAVTGNYERRKYIEWAIEILESKNENLQG